MICLSKIESNLYVYIYMYYLSKSLVVVNIHYTKDEPSLKVIFFLLWEFIKFNTDLNGDQY